MESRSITLEKQYSYKQAAYALDVSPTTVWEHLKSRGVKVSQFMLFSKKQLIRLGVFKEEKKEVYYIYESKINKK